MLEKRLLNVNCTNCRYFLLRTVYREGERITLGGSCLKDRIAKKPAAVNEYCKLWLPAEFTFDDLFEED